MRSVVNKQHHSILCKKQRARERSQLLPLAFIRSLMKSFASTTFLLIVMTCSAVAFSVIPPSFAANTASTFAPVARMGHTRLYLCASGKTNKYQKKRRVIKIKTHPILIIEHQAGVLEEQFRILLHKDAVHTFQYIVRALTKVIETLDNKAAGEIFVETTARGKAIITKTSRKQALQICVGLQRWGLTVSITPDEDYDGGHYGKGHAAANEPPDKDGMIR